MLVGSTPPSIEVQAPQSKGGILRSRLVVVALALVVAALIAFATLWLIQPAPRLPTYQEILDDGEDQDDDGRPDFFPRLPPRGPILVRDRIVSIDYSSFPIFFRVELNFPYEDGKWEVYSRDGFAPARVDDEVGAFGPGDIIELTGSILRIPWVDFSTGLNFTWEILVFQVRGGPPEVGLPVLTLRNVTIPGAQHAVEVASVSKRYASAHFEFVLFFEGQGVDIMHLGVSTQGIRMRFHDGGEQGYLDVGDRVSFNGLDAGSYLLSVDFADQEVYRFAFTIP